MRLILAAALLASAASQSCASAPAQAGVAGDYLGGRLAAHFNAVDDAARIYSDAHRAAPGEIALLRDAFFYQLVSGDIDGAALLACAMIAARPKEEEDGLARLTLAAADLRLGKLEGARASLTSEMSAPFFKAVALIANAWIEKELKGPIAGVGKLDRPPTDPLGVFDPLHKALMNEEAGRLDDARAAYQVAILGAGGPISRRGYGAFLERAGDVNAARDYYAQLAVNEGAGRRAAKSASRRIAAGRPPAYFTNLGAAEGAAIAYYSLAQVMIEQAAEQRERAELAGFHVGDPRFNMPLALARLALHLDPELEEARRLVGHILLAYGDYADGAEILSRIPASSPHFEQARLDMARGLAALEDMKGAERVLVGAIRRDPEGQALKGALANLYAAEGDHGQAVKLLNALIEGIADPPEDDAWQLYIARGAALLEMDDWDAAEADLKRAVEAAPDEAQALNYLGYSWAERGINLEEAFRLIEKAVELRPDSGAIVDSLGWAHYQLGRYAEAVGHLEKAATLEPDDPTITDHLGDVYWRLGRDIEARYEWRRGLDLDPPAKLKEQLERKITEGLEDRARQSADDGA